jgi:acetylornithine/N-succinyldiaminopimelate aminotransferase
MTQMKTSPSHIIWYPGNELLLPDIVRAENCHLYDASGKRYIDLESGVWCTCVGHNHPRVTRVLVEQAARIAHTGFNYSAAVVEEAAREILSLLRFDDGVCVFLCSGSEAVEYGVRVAQSLIGRPLLLTMHDSYFGAYGSAAKRESTEWYCFDWSACIGCSGSEQCDHRCRRWAQIPFDSIGGFLFEPGSSSGLVRFPPEKLVQSIADVVRINDGLVLINEVTTGVGRTGRWFGHDHYRLSPDFVALGKGIGNGYPVSVAAFAPEVKRRLDGKPIKYAQSHQNDPLGAVVAREVIRLIKEERLIERGQEIARRLADGLAAIKARTRYIREIRARGLMVALDLHDGPDCSVTIRTHRELARRGFLVGRRVGVSVLRIDPGLTIDVNDIDDFLGALEDTLHT